VAGVEASPQFDSADTFVSNSTRSAAHATGSGSDSATPPEGGQPTPQAVAVTARLLQRAARALHGRTPGHRASAR
jgi:hypothetical protein